MNEHHHPQGMSEADMPYAVGSVNTLLKKLGPDIPLDKIFTKEKIAACQKIIDTAKADFFQDAIARLADIHKEFSKATADAAKAAPHVRKIAQLSRSLKAKIETLGIDLIYEIAQSLHHYASTLSSYTPKTLLVIEKHIEVLDSVFNNKMLANDEPIGHEMLDGLTKLVRKMQAQD